MNATPATTRVEFLADDVKVVRRSTIRIAFEHLADSGMTERVGGLPTDPERRVEMDQRSRDLNPQGAAS